MARSCPKISIAHPAKKERKIERSGSNIFFMLKKLKTRNGPITDPIFRVQNIHMGNQPGRSLDMILGPVEIESSLSKVLEDLSLISRTCPLKASLVVQTYNPSAG